jgi:hypothetical protein
MRWLTLPVGTFSFIALIGFSAASLAAAEVEPCGKESIRTGQTRLGTGSDIYIRTGPRENADKIINEKATRILKRTEYISIDHSVKVYEECTQAGWSKISVIEPDWLRESHKGWVPSKALRAQKIDSSGVRVFTEEDFHWDKKIALYKNIIIAGVNKIHRENSRCKEIDPMSAYLSTQGTNPTTSVNLAPLPALFAVRQKGAVVALLDAGYQSENVRNRQGLQGQNHHEQAPQLGHRKSRGFFSPSVFANARGKSGRPWW